GGEVRSLLAHLGEDVVRGAVEDAVEAADAVGGKPLAQRLHNGDAARDGSLIADVDARGVGRMREAGAVVGEQRLVGGDDVFARGDGGFDQLQRYAGLAADQLHDDVDVVAPGEIAGIVAPGDAREIDAAVATAVPRAGGGDDDGTAAARGHEVA